jgi:flagellar motor switch protein FliM
VSEAQKLEDELLLAGLCGKFTDSFAGAARKLLAAEVSLSRTSRERIRAADFVNSAYSCFLIRQTSDKLEPPCCYLAFSHSMASSILGCLLGATEDTSTDKPLTTVETRLLNRVAEIAAQSLAAAVGNLGELEVSPARASVSDDAETELLVAGFEVTVSDKIGNMLLALDSRVLPKPTGSYESDRPAASAPMEISAAIEGMTIPADEIANIADGDIVTTETATDGEIIVKVAGIPKFAARLGSSRGRRAITITRKL